MMQLDSNRAGRAITIVIYLVLLLAFILRLYRLDFQSFWYDEGFSAFVAKGPLTSISVYVFIDPHPPLYYTVLHFWMKVAGEGEFSLRFLSVALGVLSIALIYRLGADLLGYRAGAYAAVLGAVNPFLLYYSQETRGYILLLALSI